MLESTILELWPPGSLFSLAFSFLQYFVQAVLSCFSLSCPLSNTYLDLVTVFTANVLGNLSCDFLHSQCLPPYSNNCLLRGPGFHYCGKTAEMFSLKEEHWGLIASEVSVHGCLALSLGAYGGTEHMQGAWGGGGSLPHEHKEAKREEEAGALISPSKPLFPFHQCPRTQGTGNQAWAHQPFNNTYPSYSIVCNHFWSISPSFQEATSSLAGGTL